MTPEVIEVALTHGKMVKKQLLYLGFIETKNKYILESNNLEIIEKTKAFLHTYRITYFSYKSKMRRSTDYRKKYFETNHPLIGKYYFCAYCGRPLVKAKVTIDHVIPVRKVQTSKFLQFLLDKKMKDVNDDKNLVASCARCNKRKGQKITLAYIIRGFLGKRKWFWILYYTIILITIGAVGIFIIR